MSLGQGLSPGRVWLKYFGVADFRRVKLYPYVRDLCAGGQAESRVQQCLPMLLGESLCKVGSKHRQHSNVCQACDFVQILLQEDPRTTRNVHLSSVTLSAWGCKPLRVT